MSNQTLSNRSWVNYLVNHEQQERKVHVEKLINFYVNEIKQDIRHEDNEIVEGFDNLTISRISDQSKMYFNFKVIKEITPLDFRNYSNKVNSWVCSITEIKESSFVARAQERGQEDTYEEVEFDKSDISDDDKEFLKLGSIFYWTIGYEFRNGQKTKSSVIRFRRLPEWKPQDTDLAQDRAIDFFENLNWDFQSDDKFTE